MRERLFDLEIEIRALERAALLRPRAVACPATVHSGTCRPLVRKGRQIGAMSFKWRKILQQIDFSGSATISEIMAWAEVKRGAATQRMAIFVAHEYAEVIGIGKYRVTEKARSRFGLTSTNHAINASSLRKDR